MQILTIMTTDKHIADFKSVIHLLKNSHQRKRVALVCPNDSHTQYVIERALHDEIADFLFFSGGQMLPTIAEKIHQYPNRITLIQAETPDEAARMAVIAVREKRADILMKGTINTDNLLRAVLNKEWGLLQAGGILSHVTIAHIPTYPKFLIFSDAAVIPRPTLEQFDAIVRYTVHIAHRLGINYPKIALTHCTEKVNKKFPHTLDYEELKHRAESGRYGQIYIGGPMDVKTACDAESGSLKGITSPVVGQADILIFPNIESGNTFYKTITLFANATTAGMLCGTIAPVVVASRADSGEGKYYSLAMACIMSEHTDTK